MGPILFLIIIAGVFIAGGWAACLMIMRPREYPFQRNGDGWIPELATNENGMLLWAEMVPTSNHGRDDVVPREDAAYRILDRRISGGIIRYIVRRC